MPERHQRRRGANLIEKNAVLVDVREPYEIAAERIPGSIELPLSQLARGKPANLPQDKAVVFHCASGARTKSNARALASLTMATPTIWSAASPAGSGPVCRPSAADAPSPFARPGGAPGPEADRRAFLHDLAAGLLAVLSGRARRLLARPYRRRRLGAGRAAAGLRRRREGPARGDRHQCAGRCRQCRHQSLQPLAQRHVKLRCAVTYAAFGIAGAAIGSTSARRSTATSCSRCSG